MSTPTPDLDAIQARADAATEGPWEHAGNGYVEVPAEFDLYRFDVMAERVARAELQNEDAAFIAHARTDVPALLAVVRSQQAALDDLMYVANHKAADNEIGRWWAEVIRGPIIEHLGAEAASKMGAALTATEGA